MDYPGTKPLHPHALDSLFSNLEARGQAMGSISIFENGIEVYQKAIGWANLEKRIKPTEKTKYRIGSVTKTYTATVILQLVDENRLSLETKIDRYFPEMPYVQNISVANSCATAAA